MYSYEAAPGAASIAPVPKEAFTDRSTKKRAGPVPRIALGRLDAAAALGVGLDVLDALIARGELRVILPNGPRGRTTRVLIAEEELRRWARESQARRIEQHRRPFGR